MAKITRINPEGISKPFSNYSHVVTAEGAQKLVLGARFPHEGARERSSLAIPGKGRIRHISLDRTKRHWEARGSFPYTSLGGT
jgi:hypothetical protein